MLQGIASALLGPVSFQGGFATGALLYLSNVKRSVPALWPLPLLVHMTCVGLPIALAVRRFGPRPPGNTGA